MGGALLSLSPRNSTYFFCFSRVITAGHWWLVRWYVTIYWFKYIQVYSTQFDVKMYQQHLFGDLNQT